MTVRATLIVLILLGLAVGWSGGLGQAGHGLAILKVSEAAEKAADPKVAAALLGEARAALESGWTLLQVSTYTGLAIVVVASLGLYLLERRRPNEPDESS